MTKHLIVNADDYGRTASVSSGIRHAHLNGIVTTTTAMMNMPTVIEDIRVAQGECPRLGLGVHLTLTAGRPVLPPAQAPTLVDHNGAFLRLDQLTTALPNVNPAELRAEWRAQIEKFLATGAALDHLDSHHHTSYFTETAFGIMLDLANEYRAPVRRPRAKDENDADSLSRAEFTDRILREKGARCPDHFITSFYDDGVTISNLLGILNTLPDGLTEIMSHPGYVDDELLHGSSYNLRREEEIEVLTSDEVKEAITANRITLRTFKEAFVV
ncbi:MAG: carbohydrate deacetylase [Chloroflexota bacterium]